MTHGGQRKGAGRKPDPHKKQTISLKMSPDVVAYLKSVNASVTVDEAIQRTKAFRAWLKEQPQDPIPNPKTNPHD